MQKFKMRPRIINFRLVRSLYIICLYNNIFNEVFIFIFFYSFLDVIGSSTSIDSLKEVVNKDGDRVKNVTLELEDAKYVKYKLK